MLRRLSLIAIALALSAGTAFAQTNRYRTAELDAANECVVLDVTGMGTGAWDVSGTYSGTVTFTVAVNGGEYRDIDVFKPESPGTAANSTTSTGTWQGSVAGLRYMRACMTSYTSGTAQVSLSAAATGGGGGGGAGGGGGGSSDTTETTQLSVLAAVDGLEGGIGAAADAAATAGSTGSISAKLRLLTTLIDAINTKLAGTLTVGDGAGALNVICDSGCLGGTTDTDDGSIAAGQSVGLFGSLTQFYNGTAWARWTGAALADNVSNPTIPYVGAFLMCFDGSTWDRCAVAQDWTIGSAIGTTGAGQLAVYSDFDGSALPTITNVDTEGEGVPLAASIKGVQYMMLVSEDGSLQYGTSTTPLVITDGAAATSGASTLKYTSAGSTEDEHAVCTGPCNIFSITVTNTNADERYIRCENDTAANTTPGSETVELDLAIPGNASGAGFTTTFPRGAAFSTAATCWLVTGAADSDVAEVAANEIKVFYTFKQ